MALGEAIQKTVDAENLLNATFFEQVVERDLPIVERADWTIDFTRVSLPTGGFQVVLEQLGSDYQQAVLEDDECLVCINIGGGDGYLRASIACRSKDAVPALVARLKAIWPPTTSEGQLVPVSFWYYSQHGPASTSRRIVVPTWKEIAGNYAIPVADTLAPWMLESFRPPMDGHLVLWRGEPGTGKTYALRAMMDAWRNWARFSYVTDPESFFGAHADYMMRVIMRDGDLPDEEGEKKAPWHVLILEDTGELLTIDAKERSGQALSRLLNVVDGIIGQGLRVLVLVTTNEEIGKMHPAVTRAGRCLMDLEFTELSSIEVRAWRLAHGLCGGSRTEKLSNLYAELNGGVVTEEARVGF